MNLIDHYSTEQPDNLNEFVKSIDFEKKMKGNASLGARQVTWCKRCKEPTTHKFQTDAKTGEKKWMCLCCESERHRNKGELKKIKAKRKGWANQYF